MPFKENLIDTSKNTSSMLTIDTSRQLCLCYMRTLVPKKDENNRHESIRRENDEDI